APADLVFLGPLPGPPVGTGRLVEQSLQELGRRLVFPGRQGMDAADVEDNLERAPRALHLCLPGQDLGGGGTCSTPQQRGVVAGGPQGLVREEEKTLTP